MGRVLYVAGYGRSGSTVLDVILGSHDEIHSAGEVAFLLEEVRLPGRRCACGASYGACEFWGGLLEDLGVADPPRDLVDRLRGVESRRGLLRMLVGRTDDDAGRQYGDLYAALLRGVRRRSGSAVVVDSSKSAGWTAGRPLALERLAGQEVYLLHLVRSSADTLGSVVRRGSNWAAEGRRPPLRLPALRTAMGWTLAHVSARAVGRRLPPERRLRVRYEALLRDPAGTLERIGEWIGIDLQEVGRKAASGGGFAVGHNVGGNRLRREGRVKLWGSDEEPTAEAEPPLRVRLLSAVIEGWLEWRLETAGW